LEETDPVGVVGRLNCGERFQPDGLDVRREFFFGDLGHGDKSSAVFENAIQQWRLRGKWSLDDALASVGDGEKEENAGILRFLGLMD
jgi:hypothetical protein